MDNPNFSYSAGSYCSNDADPTPTASTAGTYSSTTGLSINNTSGEIDVSASTPGSYWVTHTTTGTCPNSASLTVVIKAVTTSTLSPDICNTYTSPSGKVKTSSENFLDTLTNDAGCDSIITINLTVRHATSSSISPDVCDTYTSPSGKAKTASETFNDTIPNAAACDSVITITLTVRNSSTHSITQTAVDTFTLSGGAKITNSGTYIDTITNDAGCDSITTYNLTITNRIHVDAGVAVSGTGDSWSQAFKTMDEALVCVNMCNNEAEIWVKAGTYYPRNLGNGNRNSAFVITNINTRLLGGFAGTESAASQRNPATNTTILSGDIGVPSDNSDNAYHVVIIQDKRSVSGGEEVMNNDFMVDGFTITGGNANGGGRYGHNGVNIYETTGAGIVVISRGTGRVINPLISNCRFTGNFAFKGSAIYGILQNGVCSTSVSNCTFDQNTCIYGTVYNDGKEGNVSTVISGCVFDNNQAGTSGAGVYNSAYLGTSSPSITNCVFSNNQARGQGGAIYSDGYKGTSSPTITNCTFYKNNAGSTGGAIANFGGSGTCAPIVTNCIFNRNSAAALEDANFSEFYSYLSSMVVKYSSLQRASDDYTGSSLYSLGGGSNNIFEQDPSFTSTTDLDGSDNLWRTADDGLMPASGSPVINAGTTSGAPSTDIRGVANSGNKDMGAYEVGGVVVP